MSKTDYDLSIIKAVVFDVDGVLSPIVVPMDENGIPRRMANLRDGYAIRTATLNGLKIAVITGGNDESVVHRFKSLGVDDIFMTTGKKIDILQKWAAQNDLKPENIAYVGDDIPDLECLEFAGLAVAPRDAASEAKSVARYVTAAEGGYGVARELLEQVLKTQGKWPATANANGM